MRHAAVVLAALAAAASAAEPKADTPALGKAYAKGAPVALTVRLTLADGLQRDLVSTNDWKPCRTSAADWTLRLAGTVKSASSKGVVLDLVLKGLEGTWSDDTPDDQARPEVEIKLSPPPEPPAKRAKAANPWQEALEGMAGTKLEVELGGRGGVSRVSGMTAAAAKRLGGLQGDRATKALAKDLGACFSDEAWRALLDAAFPAAEASPEWKGKRACPLLGALPEYQEAPLQAVPVACKAERDAGSVTVTGTVAAGKVDENLQFPGQPGFHSLGTEHKGELRAVYAADGLKEASVAWEVFDRWDNYRMNSKADRFSRKAKVSLTVERASP